MEETPVRLLLVSPHHGDFLLLKGLLSQLERFPFRLDHLPPDLPALENLPAGSHDLWILDGHSTDLRALVRQAGTRPEAPALVALVRGLEPHGLQALGDLGVSGVLDRDRLDAPQLERTLREALRNSHLKANPLERRPEEALRDLFRDEAWYWEWDTADESIQFTLDWKAQAGFTPGDGPVHPTEWFNRVHPEDRPGLEARLAALREGDVPHFELDYRIAFVGGWRWMRCHAVVWKSPQGRTQVLAGTHRDVSDLKQLQGRLASHAYTDPLTDLPNRVLFVNRTEQALARFKRYDHEGFAVVALDVDRFRRILDSAGKRAGDQALLEISRRLKGLLRTVDTVGRLGEDQFALLLTEVHGVADVLTVARRIVGTLSEPFRVDGQDITLQVKMGITLSHSGYEDGEAMLHDAFTAMLQAKKGRNGPFELFDARMREHAKRRLNLECDMRCALAREEFRVFYQPIVDVAGGSLAGFEALVRWRHPERGLLAPKDFLGLAEDTGLIVPLGQWVLRESCRQLREWRDAHRLAGALTVSVNLAPGQLAQADLAGGVLEAVRSSGLDPEFVRLEITESALFDDEEIALGNLRRLQAHKLRFHLDDFGTGYSSLSHLCNFPIDAVKVDRSFVGRLDQPGRPAEMVKAIVMMARELGLGVTAEGVEKIEHFERLKDLKCAHAQGYYFAEPLEASLARDLVLSGAHW